MSEQLWLVFGKLGMKVIMPAVFDLDDEEKARAHYERVKRRLEQAGKDAEWSAHKIRCDDRSTGHE